MAIVEKYKESICVVNAKIWYDIITYFIYLAYNQKCSEVFWETVPNIWMIQTVLASICTNFHVNGFVFKLFAEFLKASYERYYKTKFDKLGLHRTWILLKLKGFAD